MWEMKQPAPNIHTLLFRICDYGGWPGEGEVSCQSAQFIWPEKALAAPVEVSNAGAVILVWVTHFGPFISRAARQ